MYVLLTVQPLTQFFLDKRYSLDLTLTNVNVSTISGTANLIEGSKRANIMYQMELGSILMIHYILVNPQGICSALKISVEMDIVTPRNIP